MEITVDQETYPVGHIETRTLKSNAICIDAIIQGNVTYESVRIIPSGEQASIILRHHRKLEEGSIPIKSLGRICKTAEIDLGEHNTFPTSMSFWLGESMENFSSMGDVLAALSTPLQLDKKRHRASCFSHDGKSLENETVGEAIWHTRLTKAAVKEALTNILNGYESVTFAKAA